METFNQVLEKTRDPTFSRYAILLSFELELSRQDWKVCAEWIQKCEMKEQDVEVLKALAGKK